MKMIFLNLSSSAERRGMIAQFGREIDEPTTNYLKDDGFGDLRVRAASCLSWVWHQWLSNSTGALIQQRVEEFVNQGMKMQKLPAKFYMRPLHDLYLLHCAIFGCNQAVLAKLATQVVDSSGYNGEKPRNDGELYASAWCGMLKHWILGDHKTAIAESKKVWDAYRPPYFRAIPKALATPWLKSDWKMFVKAQGKDYEKLWSHARKYGYVKKETKSETVVDIEYVSHSIEQSWCWGHVAMALLAYRQSGVEVATDPFWFPAHALAVIPKS